MKKRLNVNIFICILIAFFFSHTVLADDAVNFSAKALLPKNQKATGKSYFDLEMKPQQQQTIEIMAYNSSSESMNIKLEFNTAFTGVNGLIDYTDNNYRDESMFIAISDIVKLKTDVVTIPAKSSAAVPLTIKMPSDTYDGILLGGIRITQIDSIVEESKNITLNNKYAYVIGVKLSETDAIVRPKLHLKYAKPMLINGHTGIAVNIQNDQAMDAQDLKITTKVYSTGSQIPIREVEKEGVCLAPNSNFDFPIEWQDKEIKPGKYGVHVTAENSDLHFDEEIAFEVKGDEASQINEDAVVIARHMPAWLVTLLKAFLLVCVLAVGFFIGYYKKSFDKG